MCMFGNRSSANNGKSPDELLVPERQSASPPDNAAVASAGRRVGDRIRAGVDTILTSGQGVTSFAPTMKKTLLGQ